MTAPSPAVPERETVEALAEVLHHQHAEEFPFLNGNDLADPVPADQCGNCQRWARYAAAAVETAKAEGAETALQEAADLLGRGWGPDLFEGADERYAEWLLARADALRAATEEDR